MHSDPIIHAARVDQAAQRQADAYEAAHAGLMREVIDALTSDPEKLVRAPGHPCRRRACTALLDDYLVTHERRAAVLRIIKGSARSTDPALRLEAQALMADIAREHADDHAQDAL